VSTARSPSGNQDDRLRHGVPSTRRVSELAGDLDGAGKRIEEVESSNFDALE
jgi:hypothetical protein